MTKEEALKLLENAPRSDKPSRVNPALTQTQAIEIVTMGITELRVNVLPDLFEKRVLQVCQNQIRPRREH